MALSAVRRLVVLLAVLLPALLPALPPVRVAAITDPSFASAVARKPSRPPQAAPQVPRVQYETRVDIILVDVNVVDAQGRPVEGLAAADFRVWVNGRPRRVETAQFVRPGAPAPAGAAQAPESRVASNQDTARGRLFMLVVDEANLSMADTRALDEPLAKFFAGLAPRDRVGLVTIPMGGPQVGFTADAARVRRALEGVTGLGTGVRWLSRYNIGLKEALLFDARSPEWGDVVARECARMTGHDATVCAQDVEADARMLLVDARHRASASLGALLGVVEDLRRVEGPKTLVLVSGGMVLEREDAASVTIAREASAGNTSIYVLHLERPLVDASIARPSPTLHDDLALGRQGLEVLAGRARGELFNVPTSSEFALARIATETSGYYLLGVEAEPEDRDGKAHQVRVDLTSPRRGWTLRSRREFRVDRADAGGPTDEDQLSALLGSPATVGEIPIRASAYTMGGEARGKVQVLVGAEIDDLATGEETLLVGFVLLDRAGRPHASVGRRLALQPIDAEEPSPLRYSGAVPADPGEYTLRLAVVAPDGRRGSIEHPVAARLTRAGPLELGDLFVIEVPADGSIALRPEVHARVTEERVGFYCELYGPDARAFDAVAITVEIAATEDGPALASGPARATGTSPTRRTLQVAMSTATLPPGTYVARAVFTVGEDTVARLVRGFRKTPW